MGNILAVDDESSILKLIKRALEKDGHAVRTLADSTAVLKEPLAAFDLILLDVMMPGMDGFSLCTQVRRETDCPILFLTAKTSEEDVMKGLGLGADDYIRKPFGIGELRARVQAHLRRENREKIHAAAVGDVKFYLQEKRAVCGGAELPFTKSEYEICEYLALHRGQVFSRERIYEHVFGFDKESDDSAITEHVKNIRAKLKAAGISPIETVWGTGYKWNA